MFYMGHFQNLQKTQPFFLVQKSNDLRFHSDTVFLVIECAFTSCVGTAE